MSNTDKPTELEFSKKYDEDHAYAYFKKHEDGFWRKTSNWREQKIARCALEKLGQPQSVLDLPCGTGRFWSVLAEQKDRKIYACDYSQDMIDTGLKYRPANLTKRVEAFQGSAFEIPVEDNFVDTVMSIRLLHHIGDAADRLKILKEYHRVAKDSVILSLWVDGNLKSWRRKRLEAKRSGRSYQNRFVIPAVTIEAEIKQAGFDIVDKIDFMPLLSMWRFYVLKKH